MRTKLIILLLTNISMIGTVLLIPSMSNQRQINQKKNHLFQFSDTSIDTCTMIVKVAENSTIFQTQDLLKISKGVTIDDRYCHITDAQLPNLRKPGLLFMKQEHLYTKRRLFLPVELQYVTGPKTPSDIVSKSKSTFEKKQQLKEALTYEGVEDGDHVTGLKQIHSGTKK